MSYKIKDFESVLNTKAKIRDLKIKNLMKPGENYGSVMLSVEMELENGEKIHLVAKTPPANPEMQEMFNIPTTFKNEIYFYKNIFPLLQEFQREKGVSDVISFFPKYYGSRFNLHGTTNEIDDNAILLLEYMKNFVNLNKIEGVDLNVAKVILNDLAQLNAVPLALKLNKPEVFQKEIKPFLETLPLTESFNNDLHEKIWTLLNSMEEVAPFLSKLKQISFERMYDMSPAREPFATIIHGDIWLNNTMQKFDENGSAINKLVDFQICEYGSPLKDVLFFLFTSVKMDVLAESCDTLLNYYYECFIQNLKNLGIEDISAFSKDKFDEEAKYEAKQSQLCHILLMFFPIFRPKESVAEDFSDIKPESIGSFKPTKMHKERLLFVLREFEKRNWI